MMNRRTATLLFLVPLAVLACTQSGDSCDGSEGRITHSDIEITGVKSISLLARLSESSGPDQLDQLGQFDSGGFSNLVIDLQLSWIEEQHRFRAPNTFIQSMLDWFVPAAMACSFVPYYERYQPAVSSIDIYSDSDFNGEFPAGSNLALIFSDAEATDDNNWTLFEAAENDALRPARSYRLEPAMLDGNLVGAPLTPSMHVFTILVTLDDGQAFEIRSEEVLFNTTSL